MKVLSTRDLFAQKVNTATKMGGFRVGQEWDLQFPSGLNIKRDEQGKYFVQNGTSWVPIKAGDWIQYSINPALLNPIAIVSDGVRFDLDFVSYVEPVPKPDPNFKSVDLSLEAQPVEALDAAPAGK